MTYQMIEKFIMNTMNYKSGESANARPNKGQKFKGTYLKGPLPNDSTCCRHLSKILPHRFPSRINALLITTTCLLSENTKKYYKSFLNIIWAIFGDCHIHLIAEWRFAYRPHVRLRLVTAICACFIQIFKRIIPYLIQIVNFKQFKYLKLYFMH